MGGKCLPWVWPVGNDSFEAGDVVCYVVECVTLLAVSVFALCCPWCVVEAYCRGGLG